MNRLGKFLIVGIIASSVMPSGPDAAFADDSLGNSVFGSNDLQKEPSNINAIADQNKVYLKTDVERSNFIEDKVGANSPDLIGTAPVAYDPDKDPVFQKALRGYLMDQDLPQFFNPKYAEQAKGQTYGLQNPCAAEEGDGLDDCLAEQECTPEGGGPGVYMDVVAGDGANRTPWGEPMCVSTAQAEGGEEIIELPTFTLQDFKTLAVAPAASAVQPAPDTLRGMHTNVYAEAQPQQFATELGGFPVQVRAVPVQYAWNYGDGTVLGPTELSGAPLEEGAWDVQTDTSHVYAETGDYAVTLTTYFAGEYSVAGGPWLPVAGLNDVTSAPVSISVWRSTVRNYADDCLDNPQGTGC